MGICRHTLSRLGRIKFNENSSISSRVITRRQTDTQTDRQAGRYDAANRRILETFHLECAKNICLV
jgi:hypothetical protein